MKTEPGLVLEDRYELTSLIATGGMGQVWRGRDQDLERDVAIKVLREEYAGDEGFLKRFRAEARHTAALSHDAIAALYDYGELEGRAYIVMELAHGRPLSEIIEENPGGLPAARVISVLIDLARALDAAHSKGVVHRDVKPENILVDEDDSWRMKITDFGIARSSEQARLTKTGLVMGTAQYLSPEQAMGKQATSLSDVYALGIVAYEMLAGHRPFTGASQVDIAMAQVKQAPPELPEDIDPNLRQLVMMTLAKAPANRPRSAAAVARILESIQRGEQPRFTTGALPSITRSGDSGAAPAPSAGMAPAGAAPATRTAAMPLPRTSARRGVRHRSFAGRSGASALSGPSAHSAQSSVSGPSALSAASGPSALSASSASSAPSSRRGSRTSGSSRTAPPAQASPSGAWRVSEAPGHAADGTERTVHGTTTGRRLGPFSVPGLLLILLLIAIVVVAVLAGTGNIPGLASALPGAGGSATIIERAASGPVALRTVG